MDFMKQIQVDMTCAKCNEVSTVNVNVFEQEDLENSIKPITGQILSPENYASDVVYCPSCGEINAWDRKNQKFA